MLTLKTFRDALAFESKEKEWFRIISRDDYERYDFQICIIWITLPQI